MTELDFLRDLVVLFGASIAVVYGFNRLRLPAVVGFLVAGALLGPYGLDVVDNVARVEVFAEVGVVLLLFTIGVEFSLGQLRSLRTVAGAGLLQIGSAIVLSALAAIAFGLPLNQGVFWGFLAAMSSTAVVLQMVTERGETNSPHGRLIIGIFIVQDQAMAEILPFRDSFNSLFFISIGMLLDLRVLLAHPVLVMGLVVALVSGKMVTTVGAAVVTGYSWRAAVLTSIALAQIGEFSFILAKVGRSLGLLPGESFQVFLTVSVLTLLLTPFLLQASPRLARRAEALQRLRHLLPERQTDPHGVLPRHLRDHTIIAGYGVNGRNLAQVLRETEIPFVVVDVDGEAVRQEQKKGIPIVFGDITHPQVLRRLGIQEARALVLAISDPIATRRAVTVARQLSPGIHIIARTRYLREIEDLRGMGADQVVPEEFETSIEIFSLVLQHYRMPVRVIAEKAERIRREGYALFRKGQPGLKEIVAKEADDLYVDD